MTRWASGNGRSYRGGVKLAIFTVLVIYLLWGANVFKLRANSIEKYTSQYLKIVNKIFKLVSGTPKGVIWTWDTIKGFGEAKALKASYVFLIMVPLAARFLDGGPNKLLFNFHGNQFVFNLTVPFSWTVLYVSAILASIAGVMYEMICPKLVKDYSNFAAFENAHRDGSHLNSSIDWLSMLPLDTDLDEKIRRMKDLYNSDPIDNARVIESLTGEMKTRPKDFYFVRDASNLALPLSRLTISIAYFVAFLCLGYVLLENVYYVFRHVG